MYYKIQFILILLLLIILYIYFNFNKVRQDFTNPTHLYFLDHLKKSKSASVYLKTISNKTLKIKLNQFKLGRDYFLYFTDFSKQEKNLLMVIFNKLQAKYSNHMSLLNGTWNFVKTRSNLELGMPFTLGDTICLPKVYPEITHTLIHEWFHILQRKHTDKFNQFIIETLGFQKKPIMGNFPKWYFSNPDGLQTNQSSWVFEFNGKWWVPLLIYHPNGLKKYAYKLQFKKNKNVFEFVQPYIHIPVTYLLGNRFPNCPPSQLYHPYEIMAEMGANWVVYSTSRNKSIDYFYQHF